MLHKISIFYVMIFWILVLNSSAHAQSLADLSTAPAEQAKLEDEKLQAAQPLNMEAVQAMVQDAASSNQAAVSPVPAAAPANKTSPDDSKYTLGPNDIVEVTVMRHPEVSGQFPINSEGKIQYNFVGDIMISGLTKEDAAKTLADRLSEYIISPEVSVKIVGYNSKVIYVFGEVGAPGKVFMRGDTITIREALVQSGLPQLTGILKQSWLITPSEAGKVDKKSVNVYALMFEGDLRQNFTMKPGDVLYVPPTTMTKVLRAVTPITAPIGNVAGTARTVTPF